MPATLAQSPDTDDLANLSLEELANIQITSVTRRRESLSVAPASIFLITNEDIRRSGATTIPEVLRLAPNLQVARRDTTQYSITARGFNNAVGNKLLVMIDGRTIYTPLFSGVFWDAQDILLEDVDRIEVISGPGATLWGANAVNGVINIITKRSTETRGVLLTGDAGDDERGAGLRYGGSLGEATTFRVYGKARDWDNTRNAADVDIADKWKRGQIGFRTDWENGDQRATFQGDAYKGESEHRGLVGTFAVPRIRISGANLLARWIGNFDEGSYLRIQAYWSHNKREDIALFQPDEDILDLEIHHSLYLSSHHILWGGGYRHGRDEIEPGFFTAFIPDEEKLDWQNVFIQDEFALSGTVKAVAGLKLERNDFTGWEYLPSLRLGWTPSQNRLLWTAVSRAVRAPSRFDRSVFFPQTSPFIVAGGPDFESEVANVVEIGYRDQPLSIFNYSVTLFYHDWDNLRSGTPLPLPVLLTNNIEGEAYGVELWGNWQVMRYWRLSGGLTALDKNLEFKPGTSDTVGINNVTLHNDPGYQWTVRSSFNLPADLELDLYLRRVDALTVEPVPYYTEMNARLAWLPREGFELSVTGGNLLHEDHPEFGAAPGRSEINRSVMLGIRWSL